MTTDPTDPTTPAEPELPWGGRPVWASIDCHAGWYPLLTDLDTDLRALWPDYKVVQVKQKFGTLRFYIDTLTGASGEQQQAVRDRIHAAEAKSATICEWCGQPGQLRQRGWIATLCDDCSSKADRGEHPRWQL